MQWLERSIQALTAAPGWIAAGALAWSVVALQLDGILWDLSMGALARTLVATSNALLGILALSLACFAGHAGWFRRRHGEAIEAASLAPIPDRPWETRTAEPIGPLYLRSVRISSIVFGLTWLILLFRTQFIEVGAIVFLASLVVCLATAVLLAWHRFMVKPRVPSQSP